MESEVSIMDLPLQLKDTVVHGNSRYPFAVHETDVESEDQLMLYLHWHEEAELLLAVGGDVMVRINDRTFHLAEGEVAYIEPYALHACYKAGSKTCSFLALVFRPEVISVGRSGALYDTYVAPVERGEVRFLSHMTHELSWQRHVIELVASSRQYKLVPYDRSDLFIRSILYSIWSELFLHADMNSKPSQTYTRLAPALEYIYQNYKYPITIEEMAEKVSLSVSRFSYLFREHLHVSPVAHLLQYRLHQSSILLQSTDLTVAEIAFECGFDNLSNFNRQFKSNFGCTPTAYRSESRQLREHQTHAQDERSRMFETWMQSSETEKQTS